MAYDSIAVITNEGKRRTAEMWATGKSFKVSYFSITAGGHDPADPTMAIAPDPGATTMSGTVFFGPEAIDSVTYTSDYCPTFLCRIEEGEISGEMSSIGLIGEIVYSPDPTDPELLSAYQFLFAVYNRPRLTLAGDEAEFRISVFM